MAEYQIVYWRDIPSMVKAQEGRRNRGNAELPARFQEAIDEAAMRAKLTGTDAYMEQWRSTAWQSQDGAPQDVADTVAAELEASYSPERLQEMARTGGLEGQND